MEWVRENWVFLLFLFFLLPCISSGAGDAADTGVMRDMAKKMNTRVTANKPATKKKREEVTDAAEY